MKIGIVGFGNVGSAVRNLLIRNGHRDKLAVTDIALKKSDEMNSSMKSHREVVSGSDILFICVKPFQFEKVLKDISSVLVKSPYGPNLPIFSNKLLVSCAAGISMDTISTSLNMPIIRCMPNLPISYRMGSIIYTHNDRISDTSLAQFDKLMNGPTLFRTNDESLLDLATVLSGSMPAFVSYMAQIYIDFGIENGLSPEESRRLYVSAVEGTMYMLRHKTPETIMNEVSSEKGVTRKGIDLIKSRGLDKIIRESLENTIRSIRRLKD